MHKAGRLLTAVLGLALGPGALAMPTHMLFTHFAFTLPAVATSLHTERFPGVTSGQIQILTPLQGVDFSQYLSRLILPLKQNWYALIPEAARRGEKGKVVLRFGIQRDGTLIAKEPAVESSSGKMPLDGAAIAAVQNTAPFERLPVAFPGPYIVLRITFLYNEKMEPQKSN